MPKTDYPLAAVPPGTADDAIAEIAIVVVAVHRPDGAPLLEQGLARYRSGLPLDPLKRRHQDCQQ